MKTCKKSDIVAYLDSTGATKNFNFNTLVKHAHNFLKFTIDDPDTLLDLAWHFHRNTQILTPPSWYGGKLYTLRDVIKNFMALNTSFADLALGNVKGKYLPHWFKACTKIDTEFDYKKFNTLVLKTTLPNEKKDCPKSAFRIIDGAHRSVVLAKKLTEKSITFQPIPAIIIV